LTNGRTGCEDIVVARKRILSLVLSVLLAAGLLALLFSSISARDILTAFTKIHLPGLLLYVLISLAATGAKAARSKWLLIPHPISWGDMLIVTFVRNGFEDLLPARLGSLSYVVVLNRNIGLPFEAAASTLIVMLVFDFLTLPPFIIAAILLSRTAAGILPVPLLIGLALAYFFLVLLLLWKIVPVTRLLTRVYRRGLRLLGKQNRPWARRSAEKLESTAAALAGLQSRPIVVPLFLISVLIRFLKYVSLYVLLLALLHHRGIGLADLALWKVVLGVTAAELTSLLPVKGIADFGTWESAWVLAFSMMGIDRATAVLSGFSVHLLTNLFEYGMAALALLALAVRGRTQAPSPS
jgi:hypothetical protein